MRLDGIGVGDIVLARIKGRSVHGEVTEVTGGVVYFRPLSPAAGWRHASAREIVSHWRKAGRHSRSGPADRDAGGESAPPPPREQLSLPLRN